MEWCQMEAGKCLEFSKKMAALRKLVRLGLISENEYILAKNKIMSLYHILEPEYFKSRKESCLVSGCIGVSRVCVCEKTYVGSVFVWSNMRKN